MVTAKTLYNLANAREYFAEHHCVGDYYDEGQRISGEWQGFGAAGVVGRDTFGASSKHRSFQCTADHAEIW